LAQAGFAGAGDGLRSVCDLQCNTMPEEAVETLQGELQQIVQRGQ